MRFLGVELRGKDRGDSRNHIIEIMFGFVKVSFSALKGVILCTFCRSLGAERSRFSIDEKLPVAGLRTDIAPLLKRFTGGIVEWNVPGFHNLSGAPVEPPLRSEIPTSSSAGSSPSLNAV